MLKLIIGILLLSASAIFLWLGAHKASSLLNNTQISNKFFQLFKILPLLAIGGTFAWFGGNMATDSWNVIKNNSVKDKQDSFNASIYSIIPDKFPSHLIYIKNTKPKPTLIPIGIALYIEVTNNKSIISRIVEYELEGLFSLYEEGKLSYSKDSLGIKSFKYIPSGKLTKKWLPLKSIDLVQNNVIYVANDWEKCKQIDFSKNNFNSLARHNLMQPGESILGWVFIISPTELKGQRPNLIKVKITLNNSHNEISIINMEPPKYGEITSILSAGDLKLQSGYLDLSATDCDFIPHINYKDIIEVK